MKVRQAYVRVYVRDLNTSRPFYEQLLGEAASAQFTYEAAGLELAVIGPILTLAGTDQALAPFRETRATFIVDDVQEFHDHLAGAGCRIIREMAKVPTGMNLTVQHPDGTLIEYVQLRSIS